MRARPAGPAQSSALHDFARSGPTKEAHRRALNRSGGLQRSVAGQGHGRFLPVTLPRERPDQGKRAEAGSPGTPAAWGPIRGGIGVPIRGGIRVLLGVPIRGGPAVPEINPERSREPARISSSELAATVTVRGPKSASARPGPCTRPRSADALTRREYHPARQAPGVKLVPPRRRRRRAGTARRPAGGCGGSTLDPGSGRMVPRTRVGRSARRAAAPAGRGRSRSGAGGPDSSPGIVARPELTAAGYCRPRWRPKPGALGTERHSLWRPHRS